MKKVSDKNLFYIVVMLCLVGGILFFSLGYSKLNDSCSSLQSQNNSVRSHISELQKYYDERETYTQEIDLLNKEVANILNKYPSSIRTEDMLVEGIDMYRAANANGSLNMVFSSIVMSDAEAIFEVPMTTIDAIQSEEYTRPIVYNFLDATYSNETTYKGVRDAIGEVFKSDYPVNIERVAYSLTEDKLTLEGSIALGYFYVSGINKEYVAPKLEEYVMGTSDVFLNTAIVVDNADANVEE